MYTLISISDREHCCANPQSAVYIYLKIPPKISVSNFMFVLFSFNMVLYMICKSSQSVFNTFYTEF